MSSTKPLLSACAPRGLLSRIPDSALAVILGAAIGVLCGLFI